MQATEKTYMVLVDDQRLRYILPYSEYIPNTHPDRVCENWQILSTEMEFLKNLYAYVLKAES